jgi:hypothetical protein
VTRRESDDDVAALVGDSSLLLWPLAVNFFNFSLLCWLAVWEHLAATTLHFVVFGALPDMRVTVACATWWGGGAEG